MKTLLKTIITAAATLSLCGANSLRAQEAGTSTETRSTPRTAAAELEQLKAEVEKAQRQGQPGGFGGGGTFGDGSDVFYRDRLNSIVARGSGGNSRPLVIRFSDMEPKQQGALAEDMTIMARLFDKALEELPSGHSYGRTAMGIDLFFAPGWGAMRNLYLEGYGAVFVLHVGFPLLAPPAKTDEEKPAADSAWEEAREEVLGHPGGGSPPGQVEEYSEERVNKLKDALLDAFKSATNMRDLKSEEFVTVCVLGGSTSHQGATKAVFKRGTGGGGGGIAGRPNVVALSPKAAAMRGTILTIKARKTDIDDFAKGSLQRDDFRKRAQMTIYAGDTAGPGGGGGGGWTGFDYQFGR